MKKFSLILILMMLLSCEDLVEQTYKFNVKNETENELYFYIDDKYPDTTITTVNVTNKIIPMSTFRLGLFKAQIEFFEEATNDTLSFYFISKETVSNFDWNEIRNEYLILKRYDVSFDDFQTIDFEIVYPPTVEMENIRMYPTE